MVIFNNGFNAILSDFANDVAAKKHLTKKSCQNYQAYLRALNNANANKTIVWIQDAIRKSKDYADFFDIIDVTFDMFIISNPNVLGNTKISNAKSAFFKFALYIFSFFNDSADFEWSKSLSNLDLAKMIAQNAIFASAQTVQDVINGRTGQKRNIGKGNIYASWDNMSSIRDTKRKGQTILLNGAPVYCDDNTRANQAIKSAVLRSMNWKPISNSGAFKGFAACHIYDLVKDPRYYTSIMNLVLLPRAFAALTDHNLYVQEVLKYRAFQLFGFNPSGAKLTPPDNFNEIIWR